MPDSPQAATDTAWGALATPVHQTPPVLDLPWRDNAFLSFWDAASQTVGAFHVSTSPNAGGARARASVTCGGRSVEVIEPLAPGSFNSESITFDLSGRISVHHADLAVDLTMAPHHVAADYTHSEVFPSVAADSPLNHWQQGARVTGTVTVAGDETQPVSGFGIRDRTWGYRDMSSSITEYFAAALILADSVLSIMRFQCADGQVLSHGFALSDQRQELNGFQLRRDAAGLFEALDVDTSDGRTFTLTRRRGVGGFWIPMGAGSAGRPVMSAYDEFIEFSDDSGLTGAGMFEQGIVRRLF